MRKLATDTNSLHKRENWVRLRTIILLRWWAIIGQVTALSVAQRLYDLDLQMGLCYLAVGAAVVSNLIASFVFPESKRLREPETFMVVLFDLLQLGLLLYLTGGLNNPFTILIVGPVIVSASALSVRSTSALGLIAILLVSALIEFHLPLTTQSGFILRMPDVFLFGTWVAIVIAVVFLGVYSRWSIAEMRAMSEALQATQMALAREQKLTDLGGVVAAAAHELGTPLATIKLTSAELAEELSDDPELLADAMLIREQADRCRDILKSMGRAGKEDLHLKQAPLSAVIEEAADPHAARGKTLWFEHSAMTGSEASQPEILRKPEVVHGLRNLVQNGVDFARSQVWIESRWDDKLISVRIMDDGRGYPQHLLGKIGDPLMRRRGSGTDPRRPEYDGMGLGLFIAKTLLERTNAEVTFANGNDPYTFTSSNDETIGAIVEVTWPREAIDARVGRNAIEAGENKPILA